MAIEFDLGTEPITKRSLKGTVVAVQATLSYTKSLVAQDGSTIIEGKVENLQLGGPFGIPLASTTVELTDAQKAIKAAEQVAQKEIADAIIKLDKVRKTVSETITQS